MLDQIPISPSAALLLRPLFVGEKGGPAAVRFGGKPKLPDAMDWPEGHYFVAQIDFAQLPQIVTLRNRTFRLPDKPQSGTAFLFIRLFDDDMHNTDCVTMLYAPGDISALPEREPPASLPDLRESDPAYVKEEGVLEDGHTLVPQMAHVLPFDTFAATNPLRTNMLAKDEFDLGEHRFAHDQHTAAVAEIMNASLSTAPLEKPWIVPQIPKDFMLLEFEFTDRHMDWDFVFDWSKSFLARCHENALSHINAYREAGGDVDKATHMSDFVQAGLDDVLQTPRSKPRFKFPIPSRTPVAIDAPFNEQAERWITIARYGSGAMSREMINAYIAMLREISDHFERTDDDGYNLSARNGVQDQFFTEHGWHAGDTLEDAKDAFKYARGKAVGRHKKALSMLDPEARWDALRKECLMYEANRGEGGFSFTMGAMPLQMFGHGFEVQNAVSKNPDKVLLLQIGDPLSGIPIDLCGAGALQIWIAPQDLAEGRFDQIHATLDLT